jgi:hypothetical protein
LLRASDAWFLWEEGDKPSCGVAADTAQPRPAMWPNSTVVRHSKILETDVDNKERFSDRLGYAPGEVEITVRHDAPYELRGIMLEIARDVGLRPSTLRDIVCRVLRKRPDPSNWSEYPNIWEEVQGLVNDCEWFRVYDIIEEIYAVLREQDDGSAWPEVDGSKAAEFEEKINDYFRFVGIGWQLVDGRVEVRGPESFEVAVGTAKDVLNSIHQETASREIHEALLDLSRRPTPDLTGAVQHAMAALECVARDVCNDRKATLGAILKQHSGLIPAPLDQSVEKAWGYASNRGRHLAEGSEPDMEEAELIVGIAAAVTSYLAKKIEVVE